MMQCQKCGDTQGPWVWTANQGILCEDCYGYKEVIDKLVTLCKHHKKCASKQPIDIVTFIDGIENQVFDELGIK